MTSCKPVSCSRRAVHHEVRKLFSSDMQCWAPLPADSDTLLDLLNKLHRLLIAFFQYHIKYAQRIPSPVGVSTQFCFFLLTPPIITIIVNLHQCFSKFNFIVWGMIVIVTQIPRNFPLVGSFSFAFFGKLLGKLKPSLLGPRLRRWVLLGSLRQKEGG